jgi:hypothetical protein
MTKEEIIEEIKNTYHYHPSVDMIIFMKGKRWAFNQALGLKHDDWIKPEEEHLDREERILNKAGYYDPNNKWKKSI